ncbi:unnamed protein product [Ixodes hexagonus]
MQRERKQYSQLPLCEAPRPPCGPPEGPLALGPPPSPLPGAMPLFSLLLMGAAALSPFWPPLSRAFFFLPRPCLFHHGSPTSCLLPSISMVMARVGSLSQSCSAITTASLDWPLLPTCCTFFWMSGSSDLVGSLMICASRICSGGCDPLTWTLGLKPSGGLACPSVAVADLGDCAVAAEGDLFPRSRVPFPALCVLLELIT